MVETAGMAENQSAPSGSEEHWWSEELTRLDRHGIARLPSPDTAGLPELMATYRVPGVAVAVGALDGQTWGAGFGTTGMAGGERITARTAFQACSISKHVAAFAALRLVADGVLDLEADVSDYLTTWQLPGGQDDWRPRLTLRQLLAHTAGLSYSWYRGYDQAEPAPSLSQALRGEAPANTPPVRQSLLPGSRFRYSGSHYLVLQQLMIDVTGTPFDELMHALVLDPAGMSDSSFDQRFPHQRPGLVALGHHVTGSQVRGGWRTLPEAAAAGLWTTPGDLTRLELEIARAAAGRSPLLRRDLAGQMLTPQVPGGMGLGTEVDTAAGSLRFGHGGSNVGYRCFSVAWPAAGVAVAVMANAEGADELLGSILAAAERRYASGPAPAEGAAPGRVTGRYLLRDDYPVQIQADGDRLTCTVPGQRPVELVPLPGSRYRVPGLDCEISFGQADGDITLQIRQEDMTETGTRKS
jgi:CubicO group peptidase (beta-lactamase class C family)